MIQLNEGICYSPKPNEAYRHYAFFPSGGLAAFFDGDLQMWNLAWLTDPAWEGCLTVKTGDEALIAMQALDAPLAGYCKRALTMEDDLEDFGTPTLRSLLKLPPREFMRELTKKDMMTTLELTAHYGLPLIQTMWSRARLSQPISADVEATQFVERAMATVIPFKKRGEHVVEHSAFTAPETISVGSVFADPVVPAPLAPEVSPNRQGFHGSVAISASTAKLRMTLVAEEIIAVLSANPDADVKVTVEIQASFPSGASDQTKRTITENAAALGFQKADWESAE